MQSAFIGVLAVSIALAACTKTSPTDIKDIAKEAVTGVEVETAERIVFETRNRTVTQFATDSYAIFRELKAKFETDYKSVPLLTVQARADLENQSGESFKNEAIFEVSWSRGELDKIDFTKNLNVFTQDLLASADSVQSFNLAGDFVLTDYCMTNNTPDSQQVFCDKVIKGLYNK